MSSEYINDIIHELAENENIDIEKIPDEEYKELYERLEPQAEKIREERLKQREANPKEIESVRKVKDQITYEKKEISSDKIMEELDKLMEIPEGAELKCLRKDEDLLKIFIAIVKHPVERFGKLELPERMTKRDERTPAYRKLRKLEELELIERISVSDVWEKHLAKETLTKEEKIVLEKWIEWEKTIEQKDYKKHLREATHFFNPIGKAKDPGFLNQVINSVKEERMKGIN